MAYYPNNTVPIPTTGPHSNRSQELPARAQRTNQVQYVEERLRNGLSPLAVAGVAALLTQLDTMQTLPGVSVSLVTEVAGYRRTLTCQNNAWDGHDLTHQFLDERSTTILEIRARSLLVYGACQRCNDATNSDGRIAPTSTKTSTNDANLFRFTCLWDLIPSATHGTANNY